VFDEVLRHYEAGKGVEETAAAGVDRSAIERAVGLIDASEVDRRRGPLSLRMSGDLFCSARRIPLARKR
ncbi:MAG TPA: hypothetical protein VI643_04270, partial [Planctomycetota bacterium]|nr:hypothetical protein [Planctomycetota bacterium]